MTTTKDYQAQGFSSAKGITLSRTLANANALLNVAREATPAAEWPRYQAVIRFNRDVENLGYAWSWQLR
jgi:hypothetical protein